MMMGSAGPIFPVQEKQKKCIPFFHKWDYIYKEGTAKFEGVEYPKNFKSGYKKCSKCGFIKEQDTYDGLNWYDLDEDKTKILNTRLKFNNGKLLLIKKKPPGDE